MIIIEKISYSNSRNEVTIDELEFFYGDENNVMDHQPFDYPLYLGNHLNNKGTLVVSFGREV